MRLTAIALLAGTSLALAACGGGAGDDAAPTDAATEPAFEASPTAAASASASPSPSASATPTPTPAASASAKPAGGMAAAAAPMTAPTAFNQCKACHSVERGKHGIGPSLAGVFGDKAAAVPGFEFSDAMKSSNLTWNAANLDRFLASPQGVVPGTMMAFAGIKDAAKRKEVVDYLKTL